MALSQSALLELLDAIKEADVADRVREWRRRATRR